MKNLLAFIVLVLISQIILSQRVALVRHDGDIGYIKEDGSWFIEPSYEKAGNFSDNMAAVFNGDKWGFIDSSNKLAIDYQFDKVKRFDSGIAVVAKDKRWFYIDKNGKEITNLPTSDKVYEFTNGFAFIRNG
ncbi:MAG: WG repeat-containing protein, partial [Flavobacteriaceae bacterium]|nr:WG repeat-containing protein [Flavobacteriaceae bacterium]